ncbi:MAG: SusC/RagA family TonB-linked outer membrane protein [Odoribacter splanchnicus]|nr:SusC/RagA family TonB-linked outer membrane protein [Odoribacter splanchnicus]
MRKLFFLFVLGLPLLAAAQETRKITGQVLDLSSGQPLPGATVFIDPKAPEAASYSPAGTVTDVNGKFEFTLPVTVKSVVVSFIGYEVFPLNIAGKNDFTVRLQEEAKQLEEAVVTGYQKIEKRKVTSAVTTVRAEDIKSIGVASIDQMLEGKVAGLMATPTNGAPGAPAKMRVRSTVSLTGSTDPLWVLDGMILEGNDIPKDFGSKDNIDNLYNTSIAGVNPADIEDITILKDAAATAIYGARAANGVIVVTTKKGTKGKMRVNASASTFITTKPDLDKLNLMNASEKVDFELGLAAREDITYREEWGGVSRLLKKYDQWDAFRQGGFNAISPEAQAEINSLRNSGTNWGDEVYQNAVNQQYNLSLSGGTDQATYYLSTGYFKEKGTTIGTGFDRLNVTLKTDWNLLDNLKLTASMFLANSTRTSYMTDADAFVNPSRYTRKVNPYLNALDENGDYVYDPDILENSDKRLDFNMLEERANTDYTLKNLSLKPMVTLNYKPVSWLNLSTQFSMQIDKDRTEKMADKNSYYVRKYREKAKHNGKDYLPDGGVVQNWDKDMSQYHWKLQGEFNRTFASVHEVNVMTGVEMRGNKAKEIHTKGFGFDPKSLTTKPLEFPENSTKWNEESFRQYRQSFDENRYLSYYMTASYMYDNRYTVFGSLRYDGSNLFGVDRKYKYLPLGSISAAWNINRESFMEEADWLSNLKLRASYGLQGNVDKNTSPMIVGEWNNTSILPGANEPNIGVTYPPNPYLRWEKTSNWNLGIDFGVLRNRITMSLDGYYRVSDDLIGTRYIPGENGFDYSTMNWAKVTNKGVEFALSTTNIRTKDFRWTTDFNIAHNTSLVNRINIRDNSYTPSLKGHPIGAQFAFKTAGVDDRGLPMFWKGDNKVTMEEFFQLGPGSGFEEMSFLNVSDYRDLYTYIGDSEPKFTGGFINRFYYKNFDLTIATSFNIGQTMKETPFYEPTQVSPGENYSNRMSEVWSSDNPEGRYPGLLGRNTLETNYAYLWFSSLDPNNSFKDYDIWYKKINYLRVNSIRLGYTLPSKLAQKICMTHARVSVEARNPFVLGSSYKGYFDPESYGNIYSQPLPKTFSCGLELAF